MSSLLTVVPIYFSASSALLPQLSTSLAAAFGFEVKVRPPWFDPEMAFDPSRGQYNSTSILGQLLTLPAEASGRLLGVTSVDLFIPVLTYVFGEAQLNGRAAVVSTQRLRPEAYGLPPDASLLAERLAKEAIHELGHTLGLLHCRDATCVMRSSTYVEQIDLKSRSFCAACRACLELPPS